MRHRYGSMSASILCVHASFVSTCPNPRLLSILTKLRDLAGASTQLLRATAQNQEPPPTRARATSTVRPTAGSSIAAQSPLNRRSTPLNAAQSAALPAAQSPAAHPPVPSPPSIRRRRLNQYPRLMIPSARLVIDWLARRRRRNRRLSRRRARRYAARPPERRPAGPRRKRRPTRNRRLPAREQQRRAARISGARRASAGRGAHQRSAARISGARRASASRVER